MTPQTYDRCSPGCQGWVADDENGDIQRCDACARFDDDDQAAAYVRERALTFDARVAAFAQRVEADQAAWYKVEYPRSDPSNYAVSVKPGKKYVKVDVGTSGKYMVEVSTEKIYGIKAYGVIHRGHQYGTLDTIAAWNWGGYRATRREP